MYRYSAYNTLRKWLYDFVVVFQGLYNQSSQCTAILFGDDHVLCHIHETASQVTRIRSFQCSICKTLTGTVCRDEVLQYVKTFFEVRQDWVFDDLTNRTLKVFLRLSHQSSHTTQLTDLLSRTSSARVHHHVDGVESLLVLFHLLHQIVRQMRVGTSPNINYLIVSFVVRD